MAVASIVLNGPGRVGREFVRLLSEQAESIGARTGYMPVLRAVKSRRGILYCHDGLSSDDVREWLDASAVETTGGPSWPVPGGSQSPSTKLSAFSPSDYPLALDLVRGEAAGVIVEATSTDLDSGEPGLSHLTVGIQKGFSAVSLAKGPLVVAFSTLTSLAKEKGVSLRYSGAVAAALPTVDTAVYGMAGAEIQEIEGVLNGTTNYILNSMAGGKPYSEALKVAQSMGVAEANPRLDVEGFDSAAKILIIANTVWGLGLGLKDVKRRGITGLDARHVRESAERGTPVRLVARASFSGAEPELSVNPEPVPREHPFANLPGTSKAVRFRSKNMGDVIVSGGASDVTGAAAAALKDLIHVLEERRSR